jgi:hypothetical protein
LEYCSGSDSDDDGGTIKIEIDDEVEEAPSDTPPNEHEPSCTVKNEKEEVEVHEDV